jgi:hypothetical protein
VLARAATDPGGEKRDEFTIGWQQKKTPALGNLLNALEESDLPPDFVPPEAALSELATLLKRAQQNRKEVLGNGLNTTKAASYC